MPGSKLTDLTDSKCLGYDGDMGMNGGYYTGDHDFMVEEFYNIILYNIIYIYRIELT